VEAAAFGESLNRRTSGNRPLSTLAGCSRTGGRIRKQAVQVRVEEDGVVTAPVRPPLKWAGGKRWLLPEIRKLWIGHEHRRLVEPLCGGLAITLGLIPKRALINDINPHTISFYKWLQKGLQIPNSLPMANDESVFYRNRDRFNELVVAGDGASREASSLFYYLNRTCYNGLCRFNKSGEFNVPFGRYARVEYRRDFSLYRQVFANWKFSCVDFEEIEFDDTDFVYADPPYDVEFTQYTKEDFAWKDQERLAGWLGARNSPVVISNQATARVRKLYRNHGFRLSILSAPRLISCTGDRTRAREVLATKNL
jgi:DNA adenine methylase